MIELSECLPKLFPSMVSALPGIVRLGGLVHAVGHDREAFLKVDRPSMSFDLRAWTCMARALALLADTKSDMLKEPNLAIK